MRMVTKIKKIKKFDKLTFFIPTTGAALAILKTIIFVDNFNEKIIFVIYLLNLLFAYMKGDKERLKKIFTSILEVNKKAKYSKKFHIIGTKI